MAKRKAVFCFLINEKGGRGETNSLIDTILGIVAQTKHFTRFIAYIEAPVNGSPRPEVDSYVHLGEHDGSVVHVQHSKVKEMLGNKRVTEEQNRKKPGHTSYTPPMIIPTETCVVVIGSRGFCATLARVHMEEIAELRLNLIDILEKVCNLPHYRRRSRPSHEDLLIVDTEEDSKNYITYNLCWMREIVQQQSEIVGVIRLSQEERSFRSIE